MLDMLQDFNHPNRGVLRSWVRLLQLASSNWQGTVILFKGQNMQFVAVPCQRLGVFMFTRSSKYAYYGYVSTKGGLINGGVPYDCPLTQPEHGTPRRHTCTRFSDWPRGQFFLTCIEHQGQGPWVDLGNVKCLHHSTFVPRLNPRSRLVR